MGCTDSRPEEFGMQQPIVSIESDTSGQLINYTLPTTPVLIHVSCQNLVNKDRMSKSDPFVVIREQRNGSWVEVGRTEVITDNLNPKFVTSTSLIYKFEENQNLDFQVYDADQDYLGSFQATLSSAVVPGERGLVGQLHRDENSAIAGQITIIVEEQSSANSQLSFTMRVNNFPLNDNIFVTVHKGNSGGQDIPCYKSEIVHVDSKGCFFKTVVIDSVLLCNSAPDRNILITVSCYRSNGSHVLVAKTSTTWSQMDSNPSLTLLGVDKYASQPCGTLAIQSYKMVPKHSFLNYIQHGCELNFMVAIDFTGSNGEPSSTTSLHYIHDTGPPNSYESAIASIGGVIEYYDSDKMFPSYLFGGFLNGHTEHCFPLNGSYSNPEVPGVAGIMQWYHTAIRSVQLSGPTYFAPTIDVASKIAQTYATASSQHYLILLIITDGVINDMKATIQAIVALPLSIIIVGVGFSDFSSMNVLDGDNHRLQSDGVTASRDIVQFVPMNSISSGQTLNQLLLAEVPRQLTEYMFTHNKAPL